MAILALVTLKQLGDRGLKCGICHEKTVRTLENNLQHPKAGWPIHRGPIVQCQTLLLLEGKWHTMQKQINPF